MIALTILLTILKWLGIVLLCLLALLLVLCLCILFVPVRYHVTIKCVDQWNIRGNASWLLHVLQLSFDTMGETGVRFRIFGIEKPSKPPKKQKRGGCVPKNVPEKSREPEDGSKKGCEPEAGQRENGEQGTGQRELCEGGTVPKKSRKEKGGQQDKMKKKRFRSYIALLKDKVINFFLSFKGIFDRIKAVDSEGLQIIRLLVRNGGKLLKHILPRKLRGWVRFGTADPAQTGEILGALSILFAMYGQGVSVTPDFEQAVFEGEAELSGCLWGIVLLILVIRVHPLQMMNYIKSR